MDPTVHIVVKDVTERQRFQEPARKRIWHPLEQLTGYIIVRSSVPLFLDEAVLEFQGIYLSGPATIVPIKSHNSIQEHPMFCQELSTK